MSVSSPRCWSGDSPDRDGQSMFATVATHNPRISRAIGGRAVSGFGVTAGGALIPPDPEQATTKSSPPALIARHSGLIREKMRVRRRSGTPRSQRALARRLGLARRSDGGGQRACLLHHGVDEPVVPSLRSREPAVALELPFDALERLPGVLAEQLEQLGSIVQDLLRHDLDV